MKTSVGFKKIWVSEKSATGGLGNQWKPLQVGTREGTGSFMQDAATVTPYKNVLGDSIEELIKAGDIKTALQLADIDPETIAFVSGGTFTDSADGRTYGPADSANVSRELSLAILTNKNIFITAPRVSFSTALTFKDDDLHFADMTGTALKPEDGVSRTFKYTALDATQAAAAKILGFALAAQAGAATINHTARTVAITVATGTPKTALAPLVDVSMGAQCTPLSGVATDFTSPEVYTVEAADGTTVSYTVTVTVAP